MDWIQQPYVFFSKTESAEYNATLAITEVITGSSREKLCQGLELEYLDHRR